MGPIERGVLETLGIVNWVEIDAWEFSSQLQHKHLPEESTQRKFPEAPGLLPPSPLAKQISTQGDRQQLIATKVVSCAIEEG